MKSLKSHISLSLALFAILFSVQFFNLISRMIDTYESKLTQNYSMILLSHANLKQKEILTLLPDTASMTLLSSEKILNELHNDLDEKQITLLRATLPNFYELKFKHFPDPKEIESDKVKLLKNEGIFQVESFSNRHDQIFRLMLMVKSITYIFGAIIIIISILLILKEMRLWQFNHHDRMQIMALFGAPVWLRSAVLFRFALMDAFIATFLVLVSFLGLEKAPKVIEMQQAISTNIALIHPFSDTMLLLLIALVTSLTLALSLVIRKHS